MFLGPAESTHSENLYKTKSNQYSQQKLEACIPTSLQILINGEKNINSNKIYMLSATVLQV